MKTIRKHVWFVQTSGACYVFTDLYDHYSFIVPKIMNGNMALLDQAIAEHISGKHEFCCLRSR